MKKASEKKEKPEVEMPAKEAVKEHKRLVNVLESESHKDDKEEAKKQKKELKEYKKVEEKGKEMKKSKEEIILEYAEKVKNGEMTLEDVKKAISSSNGPINSNQEAVEEKLEEVESEEEVAEKPELKFENGLFSDFSLGSTLKQSPTGNVMNNIREHKTFTVKTVQKN